MVTTDNLYIIMPVKDAIDMAEQALQAIVASGYRPCVYDDYSSSETARRLDTLAAEGCIEVIHIADHIVGCFNMRSKWLLRAEATW